MLCLNSITIIASNSDIEWAGKLILFEQKCIIYGSLKQRFLSIAQKYKSFLSCSRQKIANNKHIMVVFCIFLNKKVTKFVDFCGRQVCWFLSDATMWKVSKYGVFSGLHFREFKLNTEIYAVDLRIQSEYGKIRTRKNSAFGHFLRSEHVLHHFSCHLIFLWVATVSNKYNIKDTLKAHFW